MKRLLILSLLLLVGAITLLPLIIGKWRGVGIQDSDQPEIFQKSPPPTDPRLAQGSPFNARPDAKVVGDSSCVICHEEITKRYQGHAMANTLAPANLADPNEKKAGKNATFQSNGMTFSIRREGDKLWHSEALDRDGKCLASEEERVSVGIGSGKRGKSYLIEVDGRFSQSPISWYGTKGIWDLSPGFGSDRHFSRVVNPQCLYCHAGESKTLDSFNPKFEPLTERSRGVGCERCHGPAGDHVDYWFNHMGPPPSEAGKPDPTIVNPKRLEPGPRNSVCNQCHLQGAMRVERRGRHQREFRPGLELEDFWTVFIKHPAVADKFKAVGQVEQMESSQCHQKSAGTMGCSTCHDPHGEPEPEKRDSFYRQKCAQCHTVADKVGKAPECSAPKADREAKADACAKCHMPKNGASDIVHVALTDHNLLKRPSNVVENKTRPLKPEENPLVRYKETNRVSKLDQERDLGIAMVRQAQNQPANIGKILDERSVPLLKRAVEVWPDDPATLLELGQSLRNINPEESIFYLKRLNRLHPEHEECLYNLASSYFYFGNGKEAEKIARDLVALTPKTGGPYDLLSAILLDLKDWPALEKTTRDWLKFQPVILVARQRLVESLYRQSKREEARVEFDIVLEQDPANRQDLLLWYHRLSR
jgi:hypothetical protein